MPEKEARPPAQNRHGGAPRGARPSSRSRIYPTSATHRVPNSGEPEFGRDAGHLAGCPACSVIAGQPGAAAPGRLSALRPPLVGVDQFQDPGANAPREQDVLRAGLFDIVNQEMRSGPIVRGHDPARPDLDLKERRRCGSFGGCKLANQTQTRKLLKLQRAQVGASKQARHRPTTLHQD